MPDNCDLTKAAAFLVRQTSQYPGLELKFDPEAKELFDSYQVFFNIRCTQCRKRQDADAAAEEGATCVVSCAYHSRCVSVVYDIYIYMTIMMYITTDSSMAYMHSCVPW